MAAFPGFAPLESNFTVTPNQFFDKVVGHYHPCVVAVVAILIRATQGWEDPDTKGRRIEADLPLSAFIRPELSEQSARRGLTGAIEAGFVVKTRKEGPRQAARYAIKWDDAEAQKRAIAKQRAAERVDRKTTRRGTIVAPPKTRRGATMAPVRGTTVRGTTESPPINKGVLKKSSPEKKEKENIAPSVLSDLSASPFSGEEQKRGKPISDAAASSEHIPLPISPLPDPNRVPSWAQLAESERQHWLEKAEMELKENFGLAVWLKTTEKAKGSIRAQRAGNLYLAAKGDIR